MTERKLQELDEKELAELLELAKIAEEKAKIMYEEFAIMKLNLELRRKARRAAAQTSQ